MQVNCHAHLFTAYTVATPTAVKIAASRVRRKGGPLMERAVESLLNAIVKRPELLSERELLRHLVHGLVEQDAFTAWLDGLGADLPVDLRGLTSALIPKGEQGLRRALDAIVRAMDTHGGRTARISDLIETVRLAFKANATEVASLLLEQTPADGALVALMMDISGGADGASDTRKFKKQIKELGDAVLAHPGRIFPFIAISTNRKKHLDTLEDCVLNRGFVGVKLYPSLGYSVLTKEMKAVLTFCQTYDVPVTMHCSQGGFYRSDADIDYCNPTHWSTLLDAFPTVRVCFAHCGGGNLFCAPVQPDGWDALVRTLLERHENAFADLSYHTDQMNDPAKEATWRERITALTDHSTYGGRILFGTDSWLVRAHVTEEQYWHWFRNALGNERWKRIATDAPRRFLGLPDATGRGGGANIARHLAWMNTNAKKLRVEPLPWAIRAGAPDQQGDQAADPSWDKANMAHFATWAYFYEQELSGAQQKKRDFPHAADLCVTECRYWTKGFEPDEMFARQCASSARRLVGLCKAQGAKYTEEWTDNTFLKTLEQMLADDTTTLKDIAGEVDEAFTFKGEE